MRWYVGTLMWAPPVGAVAALIGIAAAAWGWSIRDLGTTYLGGGLAGAGLVAFGCAPVAHAVTLALLLCYKRSWAAAAVSLLPLAGPVLVWQSTLSDLWLPPPKEPRRKRVREEEVTARPGWLADETPTGPTPVPVALAAWSPQDARTVSDRRPEVRALWELEPDRVTTEESPRLRGGRGVVKP